MAKSNSPMKRDALKKLIFEAFKDVTKGDAISVREAAAIDNWCTKEEQRDARSHDKEEHWWDIPANWKNEAGQALSYVGKEGGRFLMPAAMIAEIDGSERDPGHSVFFHLCVTNKESTARVPHHGHREYISFLRGISAKKNADFYGLTPKQIHAIGQFFKWWMCEEEDYLCADRERKIESIKMYHKKILEEIKTGNVPKINYKLTLEDAIAQFDEECRILRDWLKLAKVSV